MQPALQELLEKRRNRSIAIVLGIKERECDPYLNAMASQKLRKVVLDQFNDFHALVVDIMDSLDSGQVVLNEDYLGKLDELHTSVEEIRRMVANGTH